MRKFIGALALVGIAWIVGDVTGTFGFDEPTMTNPYVAIGTLVTFMVYSIWSNVTIIQLGGDGA